MLYLFNILSEIVYNYCFSHCCCLLDVNGIRKRTQDFGYTRRIITIELRRRLDPMLWVQFWRIMERKNTVWLNKSVIWIELDVRLGLLSVHESKRNNLLFSNVTNMEKSQDSMEITRERRRSIHPFFFQYVHIQQDRRNRTKRGIRNCKY